MAAALGADGSFSGLEWISTFRNQAWHTLSLCRLVRTSELYEAEYVKLLTDGLEKLLLDTVNLGEGDTAISEQWARGAVSSLSRLDARLDPDNGSRDQLPKVTWQLEHDEMTHFVELLDRLTGDIRQACARKEHRQRAAPNAPPHRPPSAPPVLFIHKLNYLRDQLFPPPQVGPWVDINRLRGWLSHCDTHHTVHCQFSTQSQRVFKHRPRRFIDVQRMCLVPSEYGQRYAALSYVWGLGTAFMTLKQNIDQLQQEHSFSADKRSYYDQLDRGPVELPKTIQDVIELTRRLGEQFLWVDSLCIVQDDAEDRRNELDHMGSIYANAYLTIVAAGGTAFSGLRGIKDATLAMAREPGIPHYLRHGEASSLHRKMQESHSKLQASAWNNRAWTFQEQVFSRRLLVFDDTSVAWECHCAVWLEGMEGTHDQCQNNEEVVAQGFSFGVKPSLQDYARHVTQFNRRELSYPEDALDAFSGILGILSNTAFDEGFICGLPAIFFDAALLWYNQSPLVRRRAGRRAAGVGSASPIQLPPSWAWAAWSGTVTFPNYGIRPLVQWRLWESNKAHWQSVRSSWSERSQATHTELDQPRGAGSKSTRSEERDREANGTGTPVVFGEAVSHLLFAHPLRAYFRVMETFEEVQVLLADGKDACAGMLTSCETVGQNANCQGQLCEVIAISESSVNDEDVYNVIWIETQRGIAYRKGVGRILQSAWETQDSEYIEIFLG